MIKKEKKPIAVFDIDGTIFRSSLVIELTSALVQGGIFPSSARGKIEKHFLKWSNRQGSYEQYIDRVVEVFHSHIVGCKVGDVSRMSKVVIQSQKNKVYRYTRDLISSLRGRYLFLAISGSPLEMVEAFAREWNFDYAFGTTHGIKNGIYTKEMIVPAENKKKTLKNFVRERGLSLARSVGVGDTEGDISFLEIVSKPICFNPNKRLYTVARRKKWPIVVERKDVIYKIGSKGKG